MKPHHPALAGIVLTMGIALFFAMIAPGWAAALVAVSAVMAVTVICVDYRQGAYLEREHDADRAYQEREQRALREHNRQVMESKGDG